MKAELGTKKTCSLTSTIQLADLGGARDPPPWPPKFFRISCSSSRKIWQNRMLAPPWGPSSGKYWIGHCNHSFALLTFLSLFPPRMWFDYSLGQRGSPWWTQGGARVRISSRHFGTMRRAHQWSTSQPCRNHGDACYQECHSTESSLLQFSAVDRRNSWSGYIVRSDPAGGAWLARCH